MALGTIPPWLDINPQQFTRASEAGAEAGLSAARLAQSEAQHSAQLALESQRMRQQASQEAARLSQAEHIAQMELDARKEVAQQEAARRQQEILLTNAYRQAEIGLGKSRLEQQQAVAAQKAKEAALTFAQESALAQHIAGGGTLAEGLMKYPRARSIANILKSQTAKELGPVESTETPAGTVISRKGSSHWQLVPSTQGKLFKDTKDGSIVRVNPDNSVTTIVAPKTETATSALDTTTTPAAGPSLLDRAKSLIGIGGTTEPKSPFSEGQKIRNKKDGKVYVIRNGVPVLMEESTPTHEEAPPPDEEQ